LASLGEHLGIHKNLPDVVALDQVRVVVRFEALDHTRQILYVHREAVFPDAQLTVTIIRVVTWFRGRKWQAFQDSSLDVWERKIITRSSSSSSSSSSGTSKRVVIKLLALYQQRDKTGTMDPTERN
jgi:hypothetical protein